MKVLITGASGFIGSQLAKKLEYLKPTLITRKICDLVNPVATKEILNDVKPDVIVHFAADPTTRLNESDPTAIMTNNILSTQHLLHYAPNDCHFIYASTILVYGDAIGQATESYPVKPTSVYGASKFSCEALISAYEAMGRIKGTSLRICATVGSNSLTHGLIYDLFRKIKSESKYLELLGAEPGSSKPFIHVEDVCAAVEHCMTNKFYGVYNVCPNDSLSVKEIAELFLQKLQSNKQIMWLGEKSTWAGDNKFIHCSNLRLLSTGFQMKYKTSRAAILGLFIENGV